MKKVIIPTGFMGSGSSAVTDLLTEYDCFDVSKGDFEYVFMHCPNGLFDLEDKLLIGNTSLRSDEAIRSFLQTMKSLYKKDGHWTRNYREEISVEFYNYCEQFIKDLSPYTFQDIYWYYQQDPINFRMKIILQIRRLLKRLTRGKILLERPLSYTQTRFAFPDREKFSVAACAFLDKIFAALGIKENNIVLDQLLLPYNLFRLNTYFKDNVRVIVVDRDPRDVYISNVKIWKPINAMVPLPTEPEKFCEMYQDIRKLMVYKDERVINIHFEDLIYDYENTISNLENFLGINSSHHVEICKYFEPSKSIINTQLFKRKEYKMPGIDLIEKKLKGYLYNFPYDNCTIITNGNVF